jgi:GTP-binding GTPase N-terminal
MRDRAWPPSGNSVTQRKRAWDAVLVTALGTVVLVGLFSAKDRDYQARLDALEARVVAMGGRVLKRFIQRRGVSDGGVRLMSAPLSRRFLVGRGKLDQIVMICANEDVDAVVFVNDLSDYQRRWLSTRLACPVLTQVDMDQPGQHVARPRLRPKARTGRTRTHHRDR